MNSPFPQDPGANPLPFTESRYFTNRESMAARLQAAMYLDEMDAGQVADEAFIRMVQPKEKPYSGQDLMSDWENRNPVEAFAEDFCPGMTWAQDTED